MKRVKFFIYIVLLLLKQAHGQESFHGLPALCTYSSEQYRSIDQMWDVTQDNSGVMYFGNTNGVIRFDGNNWTLIPVSRFMSIVRSLKKNTEGTLFLGSINNFGYLRETPDGYLEYISLSSQLPPGIENFNDIWHIACLHDYTFFMASRFLFVFNNLKLVEITEAKERFTNIVTIGERVFVHDKGTGLMTWEQNTLKPFAGGSAFVGENLTFVVALGHDTLLAAATGRSFFLLDGEKVTPWGDPRFSKKGLSPTCGVFLPDGTLAVGTTGSGIVVINRKGEIVRRIGIPEGLISHGITNLFADRDRNLWVTTDNGINYLEISSPFTYYLKPYGLTQSVMEAAWHNQHLYLAGTDGVYAIPWARKSNPLESARFHFVEGSTGQCWQAKPDGRQLYIPHNPGLITISEKGELNHHPMNHSNVYGIVFPSTAPGKLIASVDNGLLLVNKNDLSYRSLWVGKETPRYLQLNDDDELWMITETLKGIYRLCFSKNFERVTSQTWYSTHKGLPDMPVLSVVQFDGKTMVLTENGLYGFDPVQDQFRFDSLCNNTTRKGAYLANTDQRGNLWLEGMNYLVRVNSKSQKTCRVQDTLFRWISQYSIFHTTTLPDGSWLFSTQKGAIRYDSNRSALPSLHPPIITEIQSMTGDSVHFKRAFFSSANDSALENTRPVLPFQANSLHFQCASGCYGETRKYQFRYKMQSAGASESEWSEWSSSPVKEYTNLHEGSYSFHVATRDVFEQVSPEKVFRFTILPPWYRTPWAFAGYILAALAIIYLAIRINARQLKKANLRLEQTVRERTRKIEHQKTEIEALNEFKSRFFSNISHELRTPLTMIISPMEQMVEEVTAPVQKKRLMVMLQNGRKLLSLINQLLDLARLEKGGIRINLKKSDLNEILCQTIEPYSLFATEKGINISFVEEEPNIMLPLDKDMLEKIMDNLLTNALKFTDPGGEVSIVLGLTRDRQRARIMVQDTGTGIPEAELSRIFDRFYQARDAGSHNPEGMGIGLAFVKELVVAHLGDISVESSLGKGTTFTVSLPLQNSAFVSDAPPINEPTPEPVLTKPDPGIPDTVADTSPVKIGRANETILVVEDNEEMLFFIAENLTELYKVLLARNGKEGLALAQKEMPDLIITDVMMPVMDGFIFTRSIRHDRLTSHIPIIILTAKGSVESRIEGLEATADDYLTKPFSIRELKVRIRNLLSLRKALQKKYREALLTDPAEMASNSMDETFLNKAIRLVEVKMAEPGFGVELLCNELAMSRSSLHKKLKALTNHSATEFINTIRLKEAARQLRQQKGTISEIAFNVGFSSIPYFNVCFKRLFGMSPTQYYTSNNQP